MSSNEHSFVSPGPAGLGALAVACFGFSAVFLGLVGVGGLPILAAWLLGGGIVQFTVAVIELKDHNMTGGNVFLFFSAFFMFGAAFSLVAKFLMLTGVFGELQPEPLIEGFCWAAGALFLTVVTPSYIKGPLPLLLIVLTIDIVLWLIVGLDLGLLSAPFKSLVGWLLIAAGLIALYMVCAIVNNHVFEKEIVPTFSRTQ